MKQNAIAISKSIHDSAFLRSNVAVSFTRHRFIWKKRLFQRMKCYLLKYISRLLALPYFLHVSSYN